MYKQQHCSKVSSISCSYFQCVRFDLLVWTVRPGRSAMVEYLHGAGGNDLLAANTTTTALYTEPLMHAQSPVAHVANYALQCGTVGLLVE